MSIGIAGIVGFLILLAPVILTVTIIVVVVASHSKQTNKPQSTVEPHYRARRGY